ncbi:integrase/recombinase xerD homolog [Saccostrea cucullata]|uniref:integrase/recombinase xerD homolog n=1 Tax=Saccostrea cuccullata TaxID=36930 RepID=UPI002ED05F16
MKDAEEALRPVTFFVALASRIIPPKNSTQGLQGSEIQDSSSKEIVADVSTVGKSDTWSETAHTSKASPSPPCQPQLHAQVEPLSSENNEVRSVWTEIQEMKKDSRLSSAASNIQHIIRKGKSDSSNKMYDTYFKKFRTWCSDHGVSHLPAAVSTVAVFLSSLVQQSVSESVLSAYFYSIKWFHDFNVCINPCDTKILHMVMEGGKRILSKPIQKKEPITPEILEQIINKYGDDSRKNDLLSVRVCAMFLMGFAGFLRFNELANLRVRNISFHDFYMCLHIESSKTDVYRRGNDVLIASTGNATCPVFWAKHYLQLAGISGKPDDFIFRSVRYFKSANCHRLCNINKPISYTRAREILLDSLSTIGVDSKLFGLHSLRSGGATSAASCGVNDRLLKIHGRWKTDFSRDNYIKDSVSKQLNVTKNLRI